MTGAEVLFALQIGAQIGQTILGHAGAAKQAKEAQRSARESRDLQLLTIGQRQQQEMRALAQEQDTVSKEMQQVRGRAAASAAAANVSGNSVDAVQAEIDTQASEYRMALKEQGVVTFEQLQLARQGVRAEAKARINANQAPGMGQLLMGLAGNGLSIASQYQNLKNSAAATGAS